MDVNLNFNINKTVHLSDDLKTFLKETIVSELGNLNQELSAAIDGAVQRITADFDALRAKVEAGTVTPDELDAFRANISRLNEIDPDPTNPPASEPEPGPEPTPEQPA